MKELVAPDVQKLILCWEQRRRYILHAETMAAHDGNYGDASMQAGRAAAIELCIEDLKYGINRV